MKNFLLSNNDFTPVFALQLAIISTIVVQIHALIKLKLLQKKYYIFLLIKILEIIFF